MDIYGQCTYCGRKYRKNPRVKVQKYCGNVACQRARKRRWQRRKMATDPDYRLNQHDCAQRWKKSNPGYWQQYRKDHPSYTSKNRNLQRLRNLNRIAPAMIAKMDPIKTDRCVIPGIYYLLRKCRQIANMDAILQKVFILPMSCLQPMLIAK